MSIRVNKTKQETPPLINKNKGFTFGLEDGAEGFGFIFQSAKNQTIITVMAVYNEKTVANFSEVIEEYGDINPYSTISKFLEEFFDCDITFVKGYSRVEDMNIIVDIETE